MLEFLGDMGGLIEIAFLFVTGSIYLILDRNFKAAIITDTYKVQKYNRDHSEFYKSNRDRETKTKHVLTSESSSSNKVESAKSEQSSKHISVRQDSVRQE